MKGTKKMGRFYVDVELINHDDFRDAQRGLLDPSKVRRKVISGLVDPGATRLVLPQAVAEELGLPIKASKVRVRYADRRSSLRAEVDSVRLILQGRDGLFTAMVEPKRDTALIGAIVLEDLDFLVDCAHQRLVPRDPDYIISEAE
jgi:predicted aspartyl protease